MRRFFRTVLVAKTSKAAARRSNGPCDSTGAGAPLGTKSERKQNVSLSTESVEQLWLLALQFGKPTEQPLVAGHRAPALQTRSGGAQNPTVVEPQLQPVSNRQAPPEGQSALEEQVVVSAQKKFPVQIGARARACMAVVRITATATPVPSNKAPARAAVAFIVLRISRPPPAVGYPAGVKGTMRGSRTSSLRSPSNRNNNGAC